VSVNMHVPFSFSRIMMADLSLAIVLSVFTCWFHQIVTLPSQFFLLILVHAHTSVPCLILPLFLCMWKSVVDWTHTIAYLYAVLFCKYRASWHNTVYCLVKMLDIAVCFRYFWCTRFGL
jgi:hypothetical protein